MIYVKDQFNTIVTRENMESVLDTDVLCGDGIRPSMNHYFDTEKSEWVEHVELN